MTLEELRKRKKQSCRNERGQTRRGVTFWEVVVTVVQVLIEEVITSQDRQSVRYYRTMYDKVVIDLDTTSETYTGVQSFERRFTVST